MPWEGSELAIAPLSAPEKFKIIAGKKGEESINQAIWITSKTLVFLSDKTGFYNPWRADVTDSENLKVDVKPILPKPVSDDYAEPAWLLGASRWAALDEERLFITPTVSGVVQLGILHLKDGSITNITSPYVDVGSVQAINKDEVVFVGVTDSTPAALIRISVNETKFDVLKETSEAAKTVPSEIFPVHQAIALSVPPENAPLHVLYFPPTNPDYSGGVDGELPPCVLNIHGGPTSKVSPGLSWKTAYFTSRGWAW